MIKNLMKPGRRSEFRELALAAMLMILLIMSAL